jgi:hypothetical protein
MKYAFGDSGPLIPDPTPGQVQDLLRPEIQRLVKAIKPTKKQRATVEMALRIGLSSAYGWGLADGAESQRHETGHLLLTVAVPEVCTVERTAQLLAANKRK